LTRGKPVTAINEARMLQAEDASCRCHEGSQIMTPRKTWTLAMNSTVARILRGVPCRGFAPPPELVLRSEHRALRDIMADKQGRSFHATGDGRRSAMEYGSDPLHEDLVAFVRTVRDLLEAHARAGDYTSLAIFADPTVLGVLRAELGEGLRSRVLREVPKNLLHLDEAELSRIIAADLREAGV
jgi:protein required for attachment to host cells